MIVNESNVKDFKKRALGGTAFNADPSGQMVVDQKDGKVKWYGNDGVLIGEYGIIENNRIGLRVVDDEGGNRFFMGKDADFYGYKMGKAGADVFDDEDSELVLSSDVIFTQAFFATSSGGISSSSVITTGMVSYYEDVQNYTIRLNFFKPEDFILSEVKLEVRFLDSIGLDAPHPRLTDVDIRMNPVIAEYESNIWGAIYPIYGDGTLILNDYDSVAPDDTQEINFDGSQMGAINDGWNEFILQQNTSHATIDKHYGYAIMFLSLSGYKIL